MGLTTPNQKIWLVPCQLTGTEGKPLVQLTKIFGGDDPIDEFLNITPYAILYKHGMIPIHNYEKRGRAFIRRVANLHHEAIDPFDPATEPTSNVSTSKEPVHIQAYGELRDINIIKNN